MKRFFLAIIMGLSISLRSLKILVTIGVIIGVIVTYTAYKATPITKSSISSVVKNDFSYLSIKQTSQEGARIIELYDRAMKSSDMILLSLAYRSVAKEIKANSGIVRIKGDFAFEDEKISARLELFRIQLNYINQPIMAGFILGLSICFLIYLLTLTANGLKAMFKSILKIIKNE